MKKSGTVLIIVLFIATVTLSFFVGDYMSDNEHTAKQAEQFGKYISLAIDTVEDKGLSIDGAAEAIASNIWVAHELCDNAEISAELSNLWNTLVYEEDILIGQEDVLAAQLKDILKRYQDISPQEPAGVEMPSDSETENASESYVYQANLDDTDDLERICIVNDSPDDSYYHVSVENSQHEEIWSRDFGTSHAGEGAVFLCTLDGKEYLLEYSPWVGQGMAAYRYFLIDFQDNTRHVVQKNEVEFELYTQDHIEERIAFMDEVNALIEQSQVIVSTLGGKAVIGLASAEEFKMTEEQLYDKE